MESCGPCEPNLTCSRRFVFLVAHDLSAACRMQTYAKKKACKHMNLRARTRKPARLPDKSALPDSSHHQVDISFTGKGGRYGTTEGWKARVNTRLCGDNRHSQLAALAARCTDIQVTLCPQPAMFSSWARKRGKKCLHVFCQKKKTSGGRNKKQCQQMIGDTRGSRSSNKRTSSVGPGHAEKKWAKTPGPGR